jgi:hypothetical protein
MGFTTTVTTTPADQDPACGRLVIAVAIDLAVVVARPLLGLGAVEDAAEGVEGLALEAESDVGVDGGGDADVGVAKEFLDHDKLDALIQEQGGGRVPEVVEPDAPEPGIIEQPAEVLGELGGVEGLAIGLSEDQSAVVPVLARFPGNA